MPLPTDMDHHSTLPPQEGNLGNGGPAGTDGEAELAVKEAIRAQIESYFSPANLQQDHFLLSQMNAQMYVPVAVVAQLPKVVTLSMDHRLIMESLKDSKLVTAGEEGIRPNIKVERTTVVLREIASDTPHETLKAQLLSWDGCPPVQNLRSDVGDTWFVTMASEPDAQKLLTQFRDMTFNGKPIKARLKSENALKSLFISQPSAGADTQSLKHSSLRGGTGSLSASYANGLPLPPNGGMAVPHYGGSGHVPRMYGRSAPSYAPRGGGMGGSSSSSSSSYQMAGGRSHQHQPGMPMSNRYGGGGGGTGGVPPNSFRGSGGGPSRHPSSQHPPGPPVSPHQHGAMYGGGGMGVAMVSGGYQGRAARGGSSVPYTQRYARPSPSSGPGPDTQAYVNYPPHPNSASNPVASLPTSTSQSSAAFPPQQPATGQQPVPASSKKKKKKEKQQQQPPQQQPQQRQPSPQQKESASQAQAPPQASSHQQQGPTHPTSPRPSEHHDFSSQPHGGTSPHSPRPLNQVGDKPHGRRERSSSATAGSYAKKISGAVDREGGPSNPGERERSRGAPTSTKTKGDAILPVEVSPPKMNHTNFPPLAGETGAGEEVGVSPASGTGNASSASHGVWSAGSAAIRGRGMPEAVAPVTMTGAPVVAGEVEQPPSKPVRTRDASNPSSPRLETSTKTTASSTVPEAASSPSASDLESFPPVEEVKEPTKLPPPGPMLPAKKETVDIASQGTGPIETPKAPSPPSQGPAEQESPSPSSTSTVESGSKRVFAGYAAALMNGPGSGATMKAKSASASTPPSKTTPSPTPTTQKVTASGAKENSPVGQLHEGHSMATPSSTEAEVSSTTQRDRAHRPTCNHKTDNLETPSEDQKPHAVNGVLSPSSVGNKVEEVMKKPQPFQQRVPESDKKKGALCQQEEEDEPIINFTATTEVEEPSTVTTVTSTSSSTAATANTSSAPAPQTAWGKRSFVDVVKRSGH